MSKVKILFVCLGNICRSPTAEGVFRKKIEQQGLQDNILVDSAGTASWHAGKAPDPRTVSAAADRGYDLSHLRARQVKSEDFAHFDYVFAMDESNEQDLRALRTPESTAQLELFLHYANDYIESEVPDPYHGGKAGFEKVLDMVENASEGLLNSLRDSGKI